MNLFISINRYKSRPNFLISDIPPPPRARSGTSHRGNQKGRRPEAARRNLWCGTIGSQRVGRTRPIPRHVRPRLEDTSETSKHRIWKGTRSRHIGAGSRRLFAAHSRTSSCGRSHLKAKTIADLPPPGRKRYEIVPRIACVARRELEEYQRMLETEHQGKAGVVGEEEEEPAP